MPKSLLAALGLPFDLARFGPESPPSEPPPKYVSVDEFLQDPTGQLEVLTPVAMPSMVAVDQEWTVDLRVANWDLLNSSDPQSSAVWDVSTKGNAVSASLKTDGGFAYVTIVGKTIGTAVVEPSIVVTNAKGVQEYPFPKIFVVVTPAKAPVEGAQNSDQGGIATPTKLEDDMRTMLHSWLIAALEGANQFATNELAKRIDDMSHSGRVAFVATLLGNTVWAASALATGGASFAIGIAGVAIGAVPAIPSGADKALAAVRTAMGDYLMSVSQSLDPLLRTKAKALIQTYPDVTRYKALTLFATVSFKPGCFKFDRSYKTIPVVQGSEVSRRVAASAAIALAETPD